MCTKSRNVYKKIGSDISTVRVIIYKLKTVEVLLNSSVTCLHNNPVVESMPKKMLFLALLLSQITCWQHGSLLKFYFTWNNGQFPSLLLSMVRFMWFPGPVFFSKGQCISLWILTYHLILPVLIKFCCWERHKLSYVFRLLL